MKNLKFVFTLVLACLVSLTLNAQVGNEGGGDPTNGGEGTTCMQWDGACNFDWGIRRKGSVHVGSLESFVPSGYKFQVTGNSYLKGQLRGLSPWNKDFTISASSPESSPGSYIHMYGTDHESEDHKGNIAIITRGESGEFRVGNNSGSQWTRNFVVKPNGKVIIGDGVSDASEGFLLAVGGGIQTQQVRVCPSANGWCDYVFEPDYEKNSIEEVDAFVKKYKHLPNVPSAKEVEEEGINVAEMDATLLRQIEELWLHVIELKKENDTLKEEVAELKK